MSVNLRGMTTETRNPHTMELDRMSELEIVTAMNQEDAKVPQAISRCLPQIAQAAAFAVEAFRSGGRMFYLGAGTSGRLGVLEYAKSLGCHTAAIACNAGSAVGRAAELAIEVDCGPEVLTGSTRLKSGTAQKLILNMISTASMVRMGKVYQNLMVDVVQTNEKLCVRAENIVMQATGVDRTEARRVIDEAGGSAKTAITMILAGCTAQQAAQRLEAAGGFVRAAIRNEA